MKIAPVLTRDIDQLHVMIYEMQAAIDTLKEQLRLSLHLQLGHKAEVVDLDHFALFEADDIETLLLKESDIESTATNKKNATVFEDSCRGFRVRKGLKVERIDIELPETCKANAINPQNYLAYVLEKFPQAESEDALREMLPYAEGVADRF
jgi:IS66 C-terminal element